MADIRFLILHLGLRTPAEALDIVGRFYPADRVPALAAYLLEELFAEGRS